VSDEQEQELVNRVTRVVRKADAGFEKSGGSSRHWVRDQFLPLLHEEGLSIFVAIDAAAQREYLRRARKWPDTVNLRTLRERAGLSVSLLLLAGCAPKRPTEFRMKLAPAPSVAKELAVQHAAADWGAASGTIWVLKNAECEAGSSGCIAWAKKLEPYELADGSGAVAPWGRTKKKTKHYGGHVIFDSDGPTPSQLYGLAKHEFGHLGGVGHRESGIMTIVPPYNDPIIDEGALTEFCSKNVCDNFDPEDD